jgi:hypothetical protein
VRGGEEEEEEDDDDDAGQILEEGKVEYNAGADELDAVDID